HPGLPAAVVTTVVMILALAVTSFIVLVVGQRVIEVANDIARRYADKGAGGFLGSQVMGFLGRFGINPDSMQTRIAASARDVANVLGKQATSIVAGLVSAVFIFIFTALTSYYL